MRRIVADIAILLAAAAAVAGCNREQNSPPAGAPAAGAAPTVAAATAAQPAAAAPTAGQPAAAAPGGGADADDDSIELIADAEPDSGESPLKVQFSVDAVLDGELDGATYTWDFGDGSAPSKERNPQHTYDKPGEYLATVRVANQSGEAGWDEIDIEVEAHELPAGEE